MALSVKASLLDDGVVDTLVSVGATSGVHPSTFQTEREVLVQLFEKLGFFMDNRETSPSMSRTRVYLPIKAALGKGLPSLIASAALRRAVCAS
jgi:hypothetical protein